MNVALSLTGKERSEYTPFPDRRELLINDETG
jgi:hypothetical protein